MPNELKMIQDLLALMEVLPEPLQKAVDKALKGYTIFRRFMPFIPRRWRELAANQTGHEIVATLKPSNMDTRNVRVIIKTMLIGLYNLTETWKPKWPLEPDE